MTDDTQRRREAVNDLLNRIEEMGWLVTEYDATVDPYATEAEATIHIERDPEIARAAAGDSDEAEHVQVELLDVIETLTGLHEDGAPRQEVLNRVRSRVDYPDDVIRAQLQTLKERGEVYEPVDGTYRRT